MAALELRSVSKSFKTNKVLEDISLTLQPGETVVVFGASGTGKTVLLRLVAGVEEPSEGAVFIGGEDMTGVPPEARNVGMAFQNFALFPHLSAFQNIAAPLEARRGSPQAIREGVERIARLLKIEHVLSHAPRELSNGQKQRTALARALVAEPKILLLDDPLRNVDAKLRFEMRLELPRLLRQTGSTVLYVTQDYKEAMALGHRIAVLQGGRFVQVAGPAQIYDAPATVGVARLFGDPAINLVDVLPERDGGAAIARIGTDAIVLDGHEASAGLATTLGIRPEAVELGPIPGATMSADVEAVTPLNERTVLLLRAREGWEFLASLPATAEDIPKAGQSTGVRFNRKGVHLFERAGGGRLEARV